MVLLFSLLQNGDISSTYLTELQWELHGLAHADKNTDSHSPSCTVGICVKQEILSGLLSDVIFIHWLCSLASDNQMLFFLPNILIILLHWKGQFTSS